jgi:DNA-binding transcriptional MerR regulator
MYTIREVCDLLDLKPHVLRYWERVIPLVAPRKDRYGRRSYSRADVNLLARVKYLVQEKGLSTGSVARQLWRDAEDGSENVRSAIAEIRDELLRAKALIRRGRKREETDGAGGS